MKKFLIFALLFCVSLLYADAPAMICDEETGICYLADDAPLVEPDDPTDAPATNDATATGGMSVIRRHIGTADKAEFLAFLRGEAVEDPAATATFWGMLIIALLGGIALNLTPCVLPMLPVNLAIIGASGGGSQGFRRGLLYGTGMALTYGILGVLAAFAGVSFGTLNSSPLFNFAIAAIFVILSLAMAGVFNLDLNARFRLNVAQLNLSRDAAALLMGAVSALLAGACVAPVVISVLIFAANGSWYGCLVPFALGIGMALPWPLAGAGLSVLPKPGKFMVVFKYIFAVIIFAAAGYYTYLGIKLLPNDETAQTQDGFAALEAARQESALTGKPVLVKFTASWCKNCHAMDRGVLSDPEVREYIDENFIYVTFPAENPDEPAIAALLAEYEIPGFPAFVILQ